MNKALMSLTEFRQFAATHNVIPVARKLTGSKETPLSIYSKLANHRPGTFLLESAEAGIWARYSFIGVNSEATLTESNGLAFWSGVMPAGAPFGIDPLSALRVSTLHLRSPKLNDLPPLTGGLVGYLGYEIDPIYSRNTTDSEYTSKVELIKEEIKSGEAFQVVLSQRFSMPVESDPFDLYRVLRDQNPSPYMYLFKFEDGLSVVGSSPEALVKVTSDKVMIHPIAGTRARSSDSKIDEDIAKELLSDPKERAEHLMLVDLGRNDLGRVCQPGSVEVTEFMQIEKYSHVMHIVSTVIGKLLSNKKPIDALFAVFPAGTLSGAPKPRAMEIIEENEINTRGIYGGTIGYLDFTGNIDTCIAIRTAVIKDNVAYVQAGAGIVADSNPKAENQECINKAAAVLGAIATSNRMISTK